VTLLSHEVIRAGFGEIHYPIERGDCVAAKVPCMDEGVQESRMLLLFEYVLYGRLTMEDGSVLLALCLARRTYWI
jgi:hypothetical protein